MIDYLERVGSHLHALDVCREHGFVQRAAKIHCKQARLAFNSGRIEDAIKEASLSIEVDPDYLEVYVLSIQCILTDSEPII